MDYRVRGLGFRVYMVYGLGFMVGVYGSGVWFRVHGSGFMVLGSWFRV